MISISELLVTVLRICNLCSCGVPVHIGIMHSEARGIKVFAGKPFCGKNGSTFLDRITVFSGIWLRSSGCPGCRI
jgi:hypothetical protein